MEIDPETLFKLLQEFEKLNDNMQQSRAAMHTLISTLKDTAGNVKAMYAVGKQVNILNQILLSIGKKAGMVGMVETLLRAVGEFAKRAR